MVWQDFVIMGCNFLIAFALFPQVYENYKFKKRSVNLRTSFSTSFLLFVMGITFFSLGLIGSAIITCFVGLMWVVLFIQGLVYN